MTSKKADRNQAAFSVHIALDFAPNRKIGFLSYAAIAKRDRLNTMLGF